MLAKDAQLEARIRHLETRNVTRDSTYVPKEMDPDLMYTNNYVDAVYNPNPTSQIGSNVIGIIVRVILWIMAICAVVAVVYFVFFYRGWR